MLDVDAESVPKVEQLRRLPCTVKLSANALKKLEPPGFSPSLPGCGRRFPRLRCGYNKSFAALEYQPSLPSLPRKQTWFSVYLADLSRAGAGILHGEPLYPKERLRLVLPDGKLWLIEIVRCERISEACFNIGARFVERLAT